MDYKSYEVYNAQDQIIDYHKVQSSEEDSQKILQTHLTMEMEKLDFESKEKNQMDEEQEEKNNVINQFENFELENQKIKKEQQKKNEINK